MPKHILLASLGLIAMLTTQPSIADEPLRIGVFRVDISPPLGSPVAYAPARKIEDPLSARGIILVAQEKPIVLCAVDSLGIGNEGFDQLREGLAHAVGTTPHASPCMFCISTTAPT